MNSLTRPGAHLKIKTVSGIFFITQKLVFLVDILQVSEEHTKGKSVYLQYALGEQLAEIKFCR